MFAAVVVAAAAGKRPTGEAMKHRCGGEMMFAARHERQMRSDLLCLKESSCSAIESSLYAKKPIFRLVNWLLCLDYGIKVVVDMEEFSFL